MRGFGPFIILIVLFTMGCATPYSNERLEEIFNEEGLDTRQVEQGVAVLLPEVFFKFDSAELSRRASLKLVDVADVLNDRRASMRHVHVEGHTDAVGDAQYNQQLSENRAITVADYLVDQGLERSRVDARGFGERYPIADNESRKGRALNRRVEIVVANR